MCVFLLVFRRILFCLTSFISVLFQLSLRLKLSGTFFFFFLFKHYMFIIQILILFNSISAVYSAIDTQQYKYIITLSSLPYCLFINSSFILKTKPGD